MGVVLDAFCPKRGHGAVIWLLVDVIARLFRELDRCVRGLKEESLKSSPVPQESIFETRPLYGSLFAMDWNTPSDMVERQMLPRQTKRTEMGSGTFCSGILPGMRK